MVTIKNRRTEKVEKSDFCVHRGYPLGNPWNHHNFGMGIKCATREEAIKNYEIYFAEKVKERDPIFCHALNQILIKKFQGEPIVLSCYCQPERCHAEIIKDWIDKQKYCYNWFSNMAIIDPFLYQGIEFKSVENFYQAMKLEKDDLDGRREIASLSPFKSKIKAREIKIREDFRGQKLQVMEYALRIKFNQPKWKKYLSDFNQEIIEWNNWGDTFWGVDVVTGKGENHLGKIIMKIGGIFDYKPFDISEKLD